MARLRDAPCDDWPPETERSCRIGLLHVKGLDPQMLKERLWEMRRFFTVAIKQHKFSGLRVMPNVGTAIDKVDAFCDGVLGVTKAIG
jgi:hypothetical protein